MRRPPVNFDIHLRARDLIDDGAHEEAELFTGSLERKCLKSRIEHSNAKVGLGSPSKLPN